MSRKGISPLIAAVLLIAFTMAVASLFAQWAPQLIKDAQGDTKNRSAEIQRCSGITIEVVNGDNESVTFQQTTGESPAGNVSVTWFYANEDPLQNITSIDSNRQAVTVTAKGNSGTIGNTLEEIRIQPTNCEGAATTTYP
ncbi:MAG: archaellin/type IV pilin N-terminal domain-containing protein [Candidatus Nanohaloarchaea archaeon]